MELSSIGSKLSNRLRDRATRSWNTLRMDSICVFCGSAMGSRPIYEAAARELGQSAAERNLEIVYGGAGVGLMGALADAALAAGGRVQGVIPQDLLDRELAHPGLTELHVVDSMHARKAKMVALSDAFVALPGGLGTLDELFEIATWKQLGHHDKVIGLINVDGFFDPLLDYLAHAEREGFVPRTSAEAWLVASSVDDLWNALSH